TPNGGGRSLTPSTPPVLLPQEEGEVTESGRAPLGGVGAIAPPRSPFFPTLNKLVMSSADRAALVALFRSTGGTRWKFS
ncbi:unnamed protein product, partial [Ectocarpus sp. 12 AP-2014]